MWRTVVLATALAVSLTSCSGSDPAPGTEADATSTQADATSTEAVDVASTAPGTDLDFGEPATLVWQPAQDLTGVLDLTVDSVAEQSQSVFDGWTRDDAMSTARPYFVLVSLTNTGESDLGGQAVPLYLRDDTGALGAPWTLGGDFTACQSGPLPSPFEPGAEADMCLVYLAPDGARIQDMVFEPTEGYDPVTWTGDVVGPEERSGKRSGTARPQEGGRKRG
jgi:hypothetical protein